MNYAKYLGDLTGTTEKGVRVWFSRNKKSLTNITNVQEFLRSKFNTARTRSDKGRHRPTPWLSKFQFSESKVKGPCIFCGTTTKITKMVWNEKLGEEIQIFICENCTPSQGK